MRRFLFLTALLIAPAASGDETSHIAGKAVSFELLASKHLAVQVKVNGKGPYRLIFDTGSPVILLSGKIGKDCDLIGAKTKPNPAANAWPGQIVVKSLEVGAVKAADIPAVVMDHPTLKAMESVIGKIDGIVGYPFFARYALTIDYSAKQLTLKPNGNKPDDVMQAVMKTMFDRKPASKVLASAGQWGLDVVKVDTGPGVRVKTVFAGGPAAAAGVKADDTILTIDGRWTDSPDDCLRAVAAVPVGQTAEIAVERSGKPLKLLVTPRVGF